MKKTQENYLILTAVFVGCILMANILSSWVIPWFPLFNTGITVLTPAAIVAYPISFLMTDVIGEIWGRKEANATVKAGFIAQVFALIILTIASVLVKAKAFDSTGVEVISNTFWVVVGSMIAYLASQHADVFTFHKIRDKYITKHGSTKGGRWIWNNGSTCSSQIIDTVIFITIAFGVGQGYSVTDCIGLMIGQYAFKFIVALLDTPFFYFFTRGHVQYRGQSA